MIQYIQNKDIDFEKWDACIAKEIFPVIYANSWYLDMICAEWDALVLGDYETIMPLPFKKKMGFKYIYRPYGAQQLGVFGKDAHQPNLVDRFLQAIPKKFKWINAYLNETNATTSAFKAINQTNLTIDLSQSYEQIHDQYSKRAKRNLKKAKGAVFEQFEHDNPEMLIELFKQNKGKKLKNLEEKHYQKMLHIMHVLLHKNMGFMWNLYTEPNQLCAGVFFIKWKGRITFLFSASDDLGREKHAMTKIIDEVLIAFSGRDLLFDFEGTNIKSLAQFYKGFGAKESFYPNVQINRSIVPTSILKRLA